MPWSWLRRRSGLRKDTGPEAVEVRALTDQFYITLQAYITKIKAANPASPSPPLERIEDILKKTKDERRWPDAYDIEQQIVHLFDESTLDAEFGRRLVEAASSLPPTVSAWYGQKAREPMTSALKRAVLLRMINDIQWRYTKDEARRGYITQITKRTELVFGIAVILFVVHIVIAVAAQHPTAVDLGIDTTSVWAFTKESKLWLFMSLAGSCGLLGAGFSMMIKMKGRLEQSGFDDLKLNSSWGLIMARALVGYGAGLILYFFMEAGLLRGDLFPSDAEEMGGAIVLVRAADLGKLVIWCLLAGFSETLVPNLLSRTEHSAPPPPSQPLPHLEALSLLPGAEAKDREQTKERQKKNGDDAG